jgi:hypothetical protein
MDPDMIIRFDKTGKLLKTIQTPPQFQKYEFKINSHAPGGGTYSNGRQP